MCCAYYCLIRPQSVYRRRTEFQCNDSTEYFFTRLAEIGAAGYVPSAQDILRSRVRTTGIVETSFLVEGNTFKMYDVGGQRNERKKWIHCFENVTAVLFVAAISEYDQKLFEDESQNRMSEALSLFEEIVKYAELPDCVSAGIVYVSCGILFFKIDPVSPCRVCSSRWFRKTSIVLFLNKRDLFETKIAHSPITACNELSDYDGDLSDYESCSSFIKEKFEMRLDSQGASVSNLNLS